MYLPIYYSGVWRSMKLHLADYLTYLSEHKQPSPQTLERYRITLEAIGIPDIDSEQLTTLYKTLLAKLKEKGWGYIATYLTICSAWLRKNGLQLVFNLDYNILMDEMRKLHGTRAAYTDDDVKWLFSAARKDSELKKLLILMLYSGLRVSACYPVRYEDFSLVEGLPEGVKVFTYQVKSKGITYNAVISYKAFAALNRLRGINQQLVVQHDEGFLSPFHIRYRSSLNNAIRRDNLFHLRKGKSIFHSLRKTYGQKLLESELEPTSYDFKVLMGHIPKNTTATKFYITPEGQKIPLELIKRIALAYSKTPLYTMEVGLNA